MQIVDERRIAWRRAGRLTLAVLAASGVFLILRALSSQSLSEQTCGPFETCPASSAARAFTDQIRGWGRWAPPFLALTVAGIALAERGRRLLFVAPAACLVLVPRLFGGLPDALGASFSPAAMVGAGAVVSLTTIGGAIVADRNRRHVALRLGWCDAAAVAVCAAGLAVVLWLRALLDGHLLANQDAAILVALFAFGAGVGMRRPWFPWAHVAVAIMLSQGDGGQWWWNTPSTWTASLLFIGVTFLGAFREPLGTWLAHLGRRPLEGFFALQVLNVADAFLTGLGIARADVLEANPVARYIGMPVKILVGGVAGWLLYRSRPRLLIVPIVALLGVLAYHIGGMWTYG